MRLQRRATITRCVPPALAAIAGADRVNAGTRTLPQLHAHVFARSVRWVTRFVMKPHVPDSQPLCVGPVPALFATTARARPKTLPSRRHHAHADHGACLRPVWKHALCRKQVVGSHVSPHAQPVFSVATVASGAVAFATAAAVQPKCPTATARYVGTHHQAQCVVE